MSKLYRLKEHIAKIHTLRFAHIELPTFSYDLPLAQIVPKSWHD